MTDHTMKELWRLAAQGDKEAENRIFRHLIERFTAIASLSICRDDSKDLAHDACLSVLKSYKDLESPYEYGAWAQKVLKNKIIDHLKKQSAEKRLFCDDEFSEEHEEHPDRTGHFEIMLILKKCLRKLAEAFPAYSRALHLKRYGYDTESICAKMKISRNNLYVLLSRGRGFLRDCIFDGKND